LSPGLIYAVAGVAAPVPIGLVHTRKLLENGAKSSPVSEAVPDGGFGFRDGAASIEPGDFFAEPGDGFSGPGAAGDGGAVHRPPAFMSWSRRAAEVFRVQRPAG
jgi:hypothetical protein